MPKKKVKKEKPIFGASIGVDDEDVFDGDPKDEQIEPVNLEDELNKVGGASTKGGTNVLGFGNKVKRTDKEEELPEVKPATDVRVFYSKRKGQRIGIQPKSFRWEGKRKILEQRGHAIKFNNGRYIVQMLPGEAHEDFEVRKKIEEDFLDKFMKRYPGKVFSVDPEHSKIVKQVRELQAKERAILAGEQIKRSQGAQGPVGAS